MSKKILVLGSKGMAGHVIRQYLIENTEWQIEDISRHDNFFKSTFKLDVRKFKKLDLLLEQGNYDYVINAIGILNQDAEQNPDLAILLNSYLPHYLAKKGKRHNFQLIHISTDCVFSGIKGNYKVTDVKDGEGYYSKTKALGEVVCDHNLTFRTSIIGPELKNEGIGLYNWFIKQKGEVKGYTNVYWTGVTTIELAKAIKVAIDKKLIGLYHLVNNNKISKYELLKIFQEVFKVDGLKIKPDGQYKIDKSLVNERNDFDFSISTYKNMVSEMHRWIKEHSIYSSTK